MRNICYEDDPRCEGTGKKTEAPIVPCHNVQSPGSIAPLPRGTHSVPGYSTVTLLLFLWRELNPLKKVESGARGLLKDIYLQ